MSITTVYKSTLNNFNYMLSHDNIIINQDTQRKIEEFVFNQFKNYILNKPTTMLLSVNLELLNPTLKKIILEAMSIFDNYYINFIYDIKNNKLGKFKQYDLDLLFNTLNDKKVKEILFGYYIRILSNIDNIEFDEYSYLTSVCINI